MPTRPPSHAAHARRQYDRFRDRQSKAFLNSFAWRKLRRLQLNAEPLCRNCLANGRAEPAIDVDHVIDRSERPDLSLVMTNLQSLCKTCHGRKTRQDHHL